MATHGLLDVSKPWQQKKEKSPETQEAVVEREPDKLDCKDETFGSEPLRADCEREKLGAQAYICRRLHELLTPSVPSPHEGHVLRVLACCLDILHKLGNNLFKFMRQDVIHLWL